MEENETKQEMQQEQPMKSPFCEALMDAAGKLGDLAQPGDCAITICSDGNTIAVRKHGKRIDMLEVFCNLMRHDEDIRELVLQASAIYHYSQVKANIHTPFKEDTPTDQNAKIKPLN